MGAIVTLEVVVLAGVGIKPALDGVTEVAVVLYR